MARALVLLGALLLGCGDDASVDSGGIDGGGDAGDELDAGVSGNGEIRAFTNTVGCLCDVGTCDTLVTMTVYGPDNDRLLDVMATVNDEPLPLMVSNYSAVLVGLEETYTFTARRGDAVLSETHAAPSHFDLSFEPATPVSGMPLTVTWNITDEPNVIVEVGLNGPGMDFFAGDEADDGILTIPGTAFDGPGSYNLIVRRNAYVEGPGFGQLTQIDLTRQATLIIE